MLTILIDVFSHRFAQGVNPGSISRGVITLLKGGAEMFGRNKMTTGR